jgi:hypothetical protein
MKFLTVPHGLQYFVNRADVRVILGQKRPGLDDEIALRFTDRSQFFRKELQGIA